MSVMENMNELINLKLTLIYLVSKQDKVSEDDRQKAKTRGKALREEIRKLNVSSLRMAVYLHVYLNLK